MSASAAMHVKRCLRAHPGALPKPIPAPDFERHSRKCAVCKHPQREAIEELFIYWHSADSIQRLFNLSDWSAIYRHAHAAGLYERRRANIRAVLDLLLEGVNLIETPTPMSIVAGVRAYACLNDSGGWAEPPKRVHMTTLVRHDPPSMAVAAVPESKIPAEERHNPPFSAPPEAPVPKPPRDASRTASRPAHRSPSLEPSSSLPKWASSGEPRSEKRRIASRAALRELKKCVRAITASSRDCSERSQKERAEVRGFASASLRANSRPHPSAAGDSQAAHRQAQAAGRSPAEQSAFVSSSSLPQAAVDISAPSALQDHGSRIAPHDSRVRTNEFTPASSLRLPASSANRQSPELETRATHSKQTTGPRSNRQISPHAQRELPLAPKNFPEALKR
jgi:hypothetical protein